MQTICITLHYLMARLTNKRKQVLEVLRKTKDALSAKEIHAQLATMDLATVYRAVEYLSKEKLITTLNFDNETKYEWQASPHYHAVCSECSRIVHFDASDSRLKKILQIKDFAIEQVEITVHGTCSNRHGH